jgi:hypothetical protein
MATDNFRARLERIQQAHDQYEPVAATSVRMLQSSAPVLRRKIKKRHPIMEHLVSMSLGIVLGCLAALFLYGLTSETSLWGPGSAWYDLAYFPAIGAMALAPVLMIISLFVAAKRPGFALFSLGYLTGLVVTLFV